MSAPDVADTSKPVRVLYMAHPVGGDVEGNVARAKRWLRWAQGHYPDAAVIAPWIEAIEIIGDDDSDPAVRERSLKRDEAVVAKCDAILLVGGRVSAGMARERAAAKHVIDWTNLGEEPPLGAPAAKAALKADWRFWCPDLWEAAGRDLAPRLPIPMRLAPGAHAPAYQTAGAAGMDLHALTAHTLHPGERALIATGVHLAIPEGYEGQVRPRSSFNRAGILCALGTIDSDYRGDIGVILANWTSASYEVVAGARIAQLVVAPVARVELVQVDALPPSARGSGGFGSTGVR